MTHIHTLFQSDLIRIEEYHCRGTDTSQRGTEEYTKSHEIVFPRRGAFVRYDASGKLVADANNVLFFNSHQPYQITHPIPGGDSSIIFAVKPTVLMDMLRTFDASVDDRYEKPFAISHHPIDMPQHMYKYRLLQQDELLAQEEAVLMFIGEVLSSTTSYKGKRVKSNKSATIEAHREIVHQIKIVLGKSFRQKLKLDDITAAVNVSPFFLCRVFKLETGLSIHQYLQRLRLLDALEHLTQYPQTDLTTLALELGFASHSHFSTAFVQSFGLPPSQFRDTEMSKILKV